MNYTTFRKAWDDSGLPEYYERMDDLHRLGYNFPDGDMDHYESEALSEWLGDRYIMDISLEEYKEILPNIKERAETLKHNE